MKSLATGQSQGELMGSVLKVTKQRTDTDIVLATVALITSRHVSTRDPNVKSRFLQPEVLATSHY